MPNSIRNRNRNIEPFGYCPCCGQKVLRHFLMPDGCALCQLNRYIHRLHREERRLPLLFQGNRS